MCSTRAADPHTVITLHSLQKKTTKKQLVYLQHFQVRVTDPLSAECECRPQVGRMTSCWFSVQKQVLDFEVAFRQTLWQIVLCFVLFMLLKTWQHQHKQPHNWTETWPRQAVVVLGSCEAPWSIFIWAFKECVTCSIVSQLKLLLFKVKQNPPNFAWTYNYKGCLFPFERRISYRNKNKQLTSSHWICYMCYKGCYIVRVQDITAEGNID